MAESLIPARSGIRAHWRRNLGLAALAAAVSLLLFEGFTFYQNQSGPINTPSTPITMEGLAAAYMNDPANADSLYANRTYYVTGVPLSMQQDPGTGRYYSDFMLPGFIQLYWKDVSQASQVTPCTTNDLCQPVLAKCFLAGFAVRTGNSEVIMMNNCEFIR